MTINAQKKLALALLNWHGGQYTSLYAVGSCILSDSDKGQEYRPENHHGHAPHDEYQGAVELAQTELRQLKRNAKYPECVSTRDEKTCNALAKKLNVFLQ